MTRLLLLNSCQQAVCNTIYFIPVIESFCFCLLICANCNNKWVSLVSLLNSDNLACNLIYFRVKLSILSLSGTHL